MLLYKNLDKQMEQAVLVLPMLLKLAILALNGITEEGAC